MLNNGLTWELMIKPLVNQDHKKAGHLGVFSGRTMVFHVDNPWIILGL
jgi:hypothetical protein